MLWYLFFMTNHCARCGRVYNEGIIPKYMEDEPTMYICGVCNKCKGEYYDPDDEFVDQPYDKCESFIKARIEKYGY